MKKNNEISFYIDESMINNIQEYNVIKDEITCEICYRIVIKPKQCQTYETIFCENWINDWKTKNNSYPKRCVQFVIKEAPKIIKKLLDKLKIQCNYCQNIFNYETFLYKHFPECYRKNRLVKCPFCTDCQIKYKFIEEYESKYFKEKEQLLNEIKLYKERIKELENIKESQYKWDTIQNNKHSSTFILSNENKIIKSNYFSCYNKLLLNFNFINEIEYSFGVSLNTFEKYLDFIYLGFINENYNFGNCLWHHQRMLFIFK